MLDKFSEYFFQTKEFERADRMARKHGNGGLACLLGAEYQIKHKCFLDDDGFMSFIDKDGEIVEWTPPGQDEPSFKFYSSEFHRDMVPEEAIAVMQIGK